MKTSILGAAVAMSIGSTACAQQQNEVRSTTDNNESKVLVVYFSHTGENYAVGDISEGNTAIIAKMIADETGADIFEVKPVKPYRKPIPHAPRLPRRRNMRTPVPRSSATSTRMGMTQFT